MVNVWVWFDEEEKYWHASFLKPRYGGLVEAASDVSEEEAINELVVNSDKPISHFFFIKRRPTLFDLPLHTSNNSKMI